MSAKKNIDIVSVETGTEEEVGLVPAVREVADVPATQFDDGMGDVTQEDLIIPRLKVGQNQSPGDVAGKLYIDVSGDAVETMEIVLLKMNKSRVLFPEDFSRDSEPLCRRQDFKVPEIINDGCKPMAEKCAECAYGKWTKGSNGKQKPPRCQEVWNFLVLDYETYMPAWFSLKSTALKPARKIISMLKLRGTAKKIPAWGFKFEVEVASRSGDAGDSYVPVFSGLTLLEDDDRESMDLIHDQLAGEQAKFEETDKPITDDSGDDEHDF